MLLLNLLFLIQEPAPAAAHPEPAKSPAVQALQAACAKLAEASSYTVQQTVKEDGPPAEGETNPSGSVSAVFTAHVQKGKPTHFVQDKFEAWRDGNVLIYRNADGTWVRDGQTGETAPGTDPKADPAAVANMRTRMNLARTQVAHEMLAGLDKKIEKATSTKEGEKTVISGTFTPEGAASLGQRFSKGGQERGGDATGTPPKAGEAAGTFRCVVAADGTLESMTYDVTAKGGAKDATVERKRHVELRVSAVGTTVMEVPPEIKAKASEKPGEKPADPKKNS